MFCIVELNEDTLQKQIKLIRQSWCIRSF